MIHRDFMYADGLFAFIQFFCQWVQQNCCLLKFKDRQKISLNAKKTSLYWFNLLKSEKRNRQKYKSKSTWILCAQYRTNWFGQVWVQRIRQIETWFKWTSFSSVQLLDCPSFVSQFDLNTQYVHCTQREKEGNFISFLRSHRRAEWQSITINKWWPCYSITDCVCRMKTAAKSMAAEWPVLSQYFLTYLQTLLRLIRLDKINLHSDHISNWHCECVNNVIECEQKRQTWRLVRIARVKPVIGKNV